MRLPFIVETARAEDLAPAFNLIFRHLRPEEREARVAHALDLVRAKEFDPAGVKVVHDGPGVLGAVIGAPVAGAGGIVWPPQTAPHPRQVEIEDQLIQDVLRWLRQRGAKLTQSLLAPHETTLGTVLERNGFDHITDLWYMRHQLKSEPALPATRLTLQTYAACDRSRFHETLLRTYEETRDCPEVNGVRTVEEIIAGHRNQGAHDPQLWWLAWEGSEPVGLLLLTAMTESEGWDLVYLGVVKQARGRGLGFELTARALTAARAARQKQLTLSVDVRNEPAWNLYRAAGFEPYDRRAVYLSLYSNAPGA